MKSRKLDVVFSMQQLLLLAICFLPEEVLCLRWLSIAKVGSLANAVEPERICDNVTGLVTRQVRLCKINVDIMDSVRRGAGMAAEECQFQFRNQIWNCSAVDTMRHYGTKESAFIHAISAAAVAHAVTRACSSGELRKCGCDHDVLRGKSPEGFKWSGCSDNIAFGSAFSKSFVDSRERNKKNKTRNNRAFMNLHNNQAGRKAIEYNMRVECKCHGVSGSCQVKTCWRSLPPFRLVGNILKEKFDGAIVVNVTKEKNRRRLEPINPDNKFRVNSDLVYLEESPNFCTTDHAAGLLGTKGRVCNKTSSGPDSCEKLCCGRGIETKVFTRRERCKCSFHWCCEVRCNECTIREEINTCK